MLSISGSDYRKACMELVRAALTHPKMYFETLDEIEILMRGHETAFGQMSSMDRDEMFQSQFSKWLYEHEGISCASGWAYAIKEQCKDGKDDVVNVFGKYVNAFFDNWKTNTVPGAG